VTAKPQVELVKLQAMVHGYTSAIWFAVGILALASLIAFTFVNAGRPGSTPVASGEGVEDELPVPVVAH
jgi:hypothetical protein